MAQSPQPTRPPLATPPRARRAPSALLKALGWLAIFGIGAALGAILSATDVTGWVIGVVVSGTTVVLGFFLRRELAG